jgi:disease resistance protein RPM1
MDDGHTLDYLIMLPAPPPLLRFLSISGNIAQLPDWVGSLTYLVEFAISRTKIAGDELFGILSKAPNLKSVLFGNSFYTGHQLVARTTHNFPALKVMRVPSCDKWPKVFEFEEGSMTRLETLEVNFGGHTEKSIVGIEHLTNLKKVQLSGARGNPALDLALEQIKAESDRRPEGRFTVRVEYS